MRKLFLATLIILVLTLLPACSEQSPIETTAISGFIQIHENTLHITPVEVFMLSLTGHDPDPAMGSVTFIQPGDTQTMAAHGLTEDDFPNRIHIRPNVATDQNWFYVEQANIQTQIFTITAATEFVFTDSRLLFGTNPDSNRQHTTNDLDEFLQYFYPTVVHFIEVQDGNLIRLYQSFAFTI